ncbi:MAG: hypothetical protein RIR18_1908 [Pseudomonadota bacterium]|jgi:hypothetical protein
MSAPQNPRFSAAIERFVKKNERLAMGRTLPEDGYGKGNDAGNMAAVAILQAKPSGHYGWQHPIIDCLQDAGHDLSDEVKGFIVGYAYAIQCCTTNEGRWL